MRKGRQKKGNYKKIIIGGFAALYLVGMLLVTYLVKEQYVDIGGTVASFETWDMMAEIEDVQLIGKEDGTLSDYSRDYMQYILSKATESTGKYTMISAGLLDAQGNLIAATDECFYRQPPMYSNGVPVFSLIDFAECFTEEQMETIREYYVVDSQKTYPDLDKGYGAKVFFNEEKEFIRFFIMESEERKTEEGTIETVYLSEPVFSWTKPDYVDNGEHLFSLTMDLTYFMHFPYLEYGTEYWETWKENAHLHNYMEGVKADSITDAYIEREYEPYEQCYVNRIYLGDNSEKDYLNPNYILITNVKMFPWQAAVDELEEIYVYAALFVALCGAIVLYVTDKTYKKQLQLEETRRDFTNAIAHELKTPLAIVRNLAENIDEEESEDRKAYYTKEIVNQTEVMDSMVKEMIFISKLDSDKLELRKEPVSMMSVMKEQMEKLEHLLVKKNLQIQFWEENEFIVDGDRAFLEKAVLNLLENAVVYNKENGTISITVDAERCTIENTAKPIPEEDIPHVCEMFFTGNKSRSSDMKHMGLGLYLVKKIFDLHGLKFEIGNTDVGVKVHFYK